MQDWNVKDRKVLARLKHGIETRLDETLDFTWLPDLQFSIDKSFERQDDNVISKRKGTSREDR